MLELIPLALTLLAGVGYSLAWYRLDRRGHRWPTRRAACMLAGSLCVGVALLPPVASHDDRFEVHVVQHLLLAMAAPVFLALSAPVPAIGPGPGWRGWTTWRSRLRGRSGPSAVVTSAAD